MEVLTNIIKKLATPSSNRIGVYISSDSKMEAVYYNVETREIYRNEKTDFQYNQVLREALMDDFETTLMYLLNKIDAPSACPVFITLPHILTAVKMLPSDLDSLEIELALASEAEKSYIFKKTEPKPSWNLLYENQGNLTNSYVYSVLQKSQVEKIKEITENNGLKLFAIDISFSSLIRGLAASGILDENFDNNFKWCIAIISANNYLIAKFEGENLLNVIETPLALRSIEPDVLYPTLNTTITEKLKHEKLSNLYIVSQTESFVAGKLAGHIKLNSKIHTIDNNKFDNNPLFISSTPSVDPISPESIGAACWKNSQIKLNFNFIDSADSEEIQGILGQIGIKRPIHLYLAGGILSVFVFVLVITLMLSGINNFIKSRILSNRGEIKKLEKLDVKPVKEFDQKEVFFSTYHKNKDLLTSYDAIGAVIPEKLWIESFFIDHQLHVKIKGKAYNVEDVVTYFENIQKMAKFKNLKIKNIVIGSIVKSSPNESMPGSGPRVNNERNRPDNMNYGNSGEGLNLPPPPNPEEEATQRQNHYEFVFENYEAATKDKSFVDNLPDFARNIIFGN